MLIQTDWPKTYIYWTVNETLFISIPFTWNLPEVESRFVKQKSLFFKQIIIGGPATALMPDYFKNYSFVTVGSECSNIIQMINPLATKTTTGCVRSCKFCAAPRIEGRLKELDDWPNKPILIDNNLLASSQPHFDKVIDRLKKWEWADFNQGLDSRLLTNYHAKRLSEIKKPIIRLALDNVAYRDDWEIAFSRLRSAGITLNSIRSYALCGFDSDPAEAWERCNTITDHGIKVLPQWFHELNALDKNIVTNKQAELGWNDYERRRIMQWFYQHKRAV